MSIIDSLNLRHGGWRDSRAARDNWDGPESGDVLTQVRYRLAERGITAPDEENISEALHGEPGVEVVRELQQQLSSLGPLCDPLQDPEVTDVMLNADGRVWVDAGDGVIPWGGERIEPGQARDLAIHLAADCGQRLDDAMPFVDGVITRLPRGISADAVRVHAILAPPVSGSVEEPGVCISLRVLRQSAHTLEGMCAAGLAPDAVADHLRELVHERRNILITGGTGTGKTTLLSALLGEVSPWQRILVVEDTPELANRGVNSVHLAARRGNAEGAGEITMTQLIKQCLRMRPDRIIVGEVRGEEIADLLVALNTGHSGSAGTLHSNGLSAVPGRLEALGAMAGLSPAALARQAADGIERIIHLRRTPVGRRIEAIGALRLDSRDRLMVERLWEAR